MSTGDSCEYTDDCGGNKSESSNNMFMGSTPVDADMPNSKNTDTQQSVKHTVDDEARNTTQTQNVAVLENQDPSSNVENVTELMNNLIFNTLLNNYPVNSSSLPANANGIVEHDVQSVNSLKYLQNQQMLLNPLLQITPNHVRHQMIGNPNVMWNVASNFALERAAKLHKAKTSYLYEASCTWSGILPPRHSQPIEFSSKVFLGGVPWNITEQTLMQALKHYNPIKIEWPGKESKTSQPKGYVYVILESEKQVRSLLQACHYKYVNEDHWFFKISLKRMKFKEVQVIPWSVTDSTCVKSVSHKLDPSKTVFVGALHGTLTAEGLAQIMNDLFDGVIYAGIDTDKHKYPIGSGRVTFNNARSYMRAVTAAFIEIKTTKFTKMVQIDPYLENSLCAVCAVQQGPYFCRDPLCFRYYCRSCWQLIHYYDGYRTHQPLMRSSKSTAIIGLNNEPPQLQFQGHKIKDATNVPPNYLEMKRYFPRNK